MEFFGILILYFIGTFFWGLITGSSSSGSAWGNPLSLKIEELSSDEKAETLIDVPMYGVYIKGNPNITSYEDTSICFKLYDADSGLTVQSTFENTSEVDGRGFEHIVSLGSDMPGKYWPDWVRISALIPDSLIGPYKGKRKLHLKCTFWPSNNARVYRGGVLLEELKQYEQTFGTMGSHIFELDLISTLAMVPVPKKSPQPNQPSFS